MRNWWITSLLGLLLFLSGCGISTQDAPSNSQENTPAEITGYVMDQKDGRILVVEPTKPESEGSARAMWISHVPEKSWTGKQVDVWIDGEINESFPEQATADQVSVVEMSNVEGADLTVSEALSAALSEQVFDDILSVGMISFEKEEDQWTVKMHKVGTGNGMLKEVVPDQK